LYSYEDAKSEVLRALLIKITFFIVTPFRFVRSYRLSKELVVSMLTVNAV
jgi:hypothetical protein